ncbi:hypothetical protein WJX77_003926 [Trebouxia sp. C0004]
MPSLVTCVSGSSVQQLNGFCEDYHLRLTEVAVLDAKQPIMHFQPEQQDHIPVRNQKSGNTFAVLVDDVHAMPSFAVK